MSDQEPSLKSGLDAGAGQPSPAERKKRVLLVEDEPLTRLILLNKLRIAGFSVDVAWNGYLALEKLRNSPPDAIFLDLMLPDIKGVEVIREARQDPKFGNRPIYVCTSATMMNVWARRAAKAGANKVYNKVSTPIDSIVAEVAADLLGSAHSKGSAQIESSAEPDALPPAVKENVAALPQQIQQLAQCDSPAAKVDKCGELRGRVHSVANDMALAGRHSVAREAVALEAFLKELGDKPKHINESSLRTISSAVEVIDTLAAATVTSPEPEPKEYGAVVVGDDLVSRTAISNALRNTGFKPTTFAQPAQAKEHLTVHKADLVVMDLSASEQGAIDLCKKLRDDPAHGKPSVIFVGNQRDLKKPTRTLAATAAELMVKPFLSMELALKALSLVLKNRAPAKPPASATAATTPVAAAPAPAALAVPAASAKASAAANQPPLIQSDVIQSQSPSSVSPIAMRAPTLSPTPAEQARLESASATPDGEPVPSSGPEPGVIEINETSQIVSADLACAAQFGWESVELIGQDLGILLKSGLNNDVGRFLQRSDAAVQGTERPTFPVTAKRKDGSEFPSAVTLEPRLDGSHFYWTVIFRRSDRASAAARPGFAPDGPSAHSQTTALAEALARLQQSQATLQSANDELHRQFEAISVEAVAQRETLEKNEKQREEMAGRIYTAEIELNRARTALERETEERKQLEQRLQEITSAKADLEKQLAEQVKSNEELLATSGQLREQRDEATAAADRIEGDRKEQTARASRFEEELAALRQAHGELTNKLTHEQQAVTEAKGHHQELENRLRENASELERVKAELEKQTAERISLEAGIREQLATAKGAAEKAEAAWVEEAEKSGRLEKELAGLRQERDEVQARLTGDQQAAEQAAAALKQRTDELERQLHESAAELERARAELAKQSSERGNFESDLRSQLEAANASAGKIEAAFKEEAGRCIRLEAEIASLQRVRDELTGKYAEEQRAVTDFKQRQEEVEKQLRGSVEELQRVKAELDKHTSERGGLESELREQLNAANAAAEEKTRLHRQLEQEAAGLRKTHEELRNQFVSEQESGAKSKRRVKELEKNLRENANGFATTRGELQKRMAERERAELELRAELENEKTARTEDSARHTRLESDLTALRELHEELNSQWKSEQHTVAELKRQQEDVENRLRETAAELGRAKAAIENHAAERARLESDQKNVVGTQEVLGTELCQLRESEAGYKAELSELERRIRDGVASLARATADLEKERGERRRTEQRAATLSAQLQELHTELRQHLESEKETRARLADLEQQVREREDTVARVNADLNKESAERQLAEEQLRAAGDMSAQLRKYLSLFEESKKVFKRSQDDLESRLQASIGASSDHDAKLQKEISERQRLEEALAVAQRNLAEQSQKSSLEMSKLQSALQVEEFERKRLEGDAVQARFASLDSARVGRTLVNSLRREIRQPVDNLLQNTRRLLEVELKDDQKKLVETMLENALLHNQVFRKPRA